MDREGILSVLPDDEGFFGQYGGRFVPEVLVPALDELSEVYQDAKKDSNFQDCLQKMMNTYSGRPTPLTFAERLTKDLGGAKVYLKREDLNHTGAHKINNAIGQILLAERMGKTRIIAETGAGQHGVATATVAAKFGLKCLVFMGEEDTKRQALNVFRMRLLGAEVISVTSGSRTLKDAVNAAIRDWVSHISSTHYLIGSVVGPHPYPMIVRDFQTVIGAETRQQIMNVSNRLPDKIVACVGGGSNAIGMFAPFIGCKEVELVGIEAGGFGEMPGQHAASLERGSPGLLHGALSYLLQTEDGQIEEAHSISAGLDYPGVGPEHSYLKDTGRVSYETVEDNEALDAISFLSRTEGIIPALESAHAVAYVRKIAPQMAPEQSIIICLSGRGDKDIDAIRAKLNI